MSSPKSVCGTSREGTRIVLREITATLQNSSPTQIFRRKSGADSSTPRKNVEHEVVNVRFAREFADVAHPSAPESLTSASSFHSLSSTLSSKSTGGACPAAESASAPTHLSPNNSYANVVIPGLEELIVGCADIRLDSAEESLVRDSQDLSQDQTFASATDEPILRASSRASSPSAPSPPAAQPDGFELVKEHARHSESSTVTLLNSTVDGESNNGRNEESKEANKEEANPADGSEESPQGSSESSVCRDDVVANEPPDIDATALKANFPIESPTAPDSDNALLQELQEDSEALETKSLNSTVGLGNDVNTLPEKHGTIVNGDANSDATSHTEIGIEPSSGVRKSESPSKSLDDTVILQDVSSGECLTEDVQYVEFKPQRQSTSLTTDLTTADQVNFHEFTLAAQQVANDIYNSSFEQTEGSERFVSCEVFQDPTSFDFLLARGNSKNTLRDLRAESLYAKFDPLVGGNVSMLPQGNNQTISEDDDGKTESNEPVRHEPATPKRNPAIAAIDRLLFYSPLPASGADAKSVETPEKNVSKTDVAMNIDANMAKELEIVRATVLQLEEELEKQKREHEAELERQSNAFQEKLTKLQGQLAQEIKNKNQMTVVMDEYEKSISRLVSERERDRVTLEQEKAKLQEELQAANHHLNNTEAAFNDVHLKYERLKGVVSAYKSNETVLKESIQENVETIKALENRYDQLKSHAMAQLEKANLELDAIKKQHEAETVKLHAMVRKAELKSNSLAELVEQKTKENKELAQILDEVIARVGRQNAAE